MTKEQIEEILNRVRTWPADLQEDAVRMLLAMEATDAEPLELTPEEIADLEEALAEADRGEFATEEEVKAVFRRYS
jgi:predicted transcriptional regulator